MNRGIAAIWWGMLVATVAAVVPVAVTLLSKALTSARNIERYTAEALDGGVKIAGNTANVTALKDTISVAGGLLAGANSIHGHTSAIASVLAPSSVAASAPGNSAKAAQSGNGTGNAEEVSL